MERIMQIITAATKDDSSHYPSYETAIFDDSDVRPRGRPCIPKITKFWRDTGKEKIIFDSVPQNVECYNGYDDLDLQNMKNPTQIISYNLWNGGSLTYAKVICDADYHCVSEVFIFDTVEQIIAVGSANHNSAPFVICKECEFFSSHSDSPNIKLTEIPTPDEIRVAIMTYIKTFILPKKSNFITSYDEEDADIIINMILTNRIIIKNDKFTDPKQLKFALNQCTISNINYTMCCENEFPEFYIFDNNKLCTIVKGGWSPFKDEDNAVILAHRDITKKMLNKLAITSSAFFIEHFKQISRSVLQMFDFVDGEFRKRVYCEKNVDALSLRSIFECACPNSKRIFSYVPILIFFPDHNNTKNFIIDGEHWIGDHSDNE